MKKYKLIIQILTFNLLGEIIFSLFSFHSLSIYIILFTIFNSYFIYIVLGFIKRKRVIYTYYIFKTILLLIFYLYFKVYNSTLTLGVIFSSFKVILFSKNILALILESIPFISLIIILCIVFILLTKNINFNKNKKWDFLVFLVLYFMLILSLQVNKNEIYSAYNLYFNKNYPLKNMQTFGVLTSFRLDIQRSIIVFKEKTIAIKNIQGKYSIDDYNILDINFTKSSNSEINEINKYLENQIPTYKNEMTGLFKNKNLIFIIAESFHSIAIDEKLTPNLYRLKKDGYAFNNYYNPLYPVSTADGQYLYDQGLFPSDATNSLIKTNNNYHPYSLANVFNNLGYNTYSYHDYLFDYYERDKYYDSMGFDSYKAVGKGLDIDTSNGYSDYDMVKDSVSEYISDEHFFAYYLTMSGHPWYKNDNKIAKRNINKLNSYNYSAETKVYMATQIELDKMIGELFCSLEEAKKLDDTVIVLVPDHVPYGLTINQMNELSDYERDGDFEKYHSDFIIYNKDINDLEISDVYLSNIDVLPTLLNLFGINYDSRLLIGKDAFGVADNIVVFGNRSLISSEFKYNNMNDYMEGNITYQKIQNLKEKIYEKYHVSRLILENDYYRYLFN